MTETVTIITQDGTRITTVKPVSGSARPHLSGRLASAGEVALLGRFLPELAGASVPAPFNSELGVSVTHSSRQDAGDGHVIGLTARRSSGYINKAWRCRYVNSFELPNSDGAR